VSRALHVGHDKKFGFSQLFHVGFWAIEFFSPTM
jgi:hypothetical protein